MADLRASHGQPAAGPAARSASPVATESQQASTKVPLAPVIQQTSALALSAGTPVKHSAPALTHDAGAVHDDPDSYHISSGHHGGPECDTNTYQRGSAARSYANDGVEPGNHIGETAVPSARG